MGDPVDEIIIEIVAIGTTQRVTAMDPATLVEVVFQTPVDTDRATIMQLARQKLAYRVAGRAASPTKPPDRGGTLA